MTKMLDPLDTDVEQLSHSSLGACSFSVFLPGGRSWTWV